MSLPLFAADRMPRICRARHGAPTPASRRTRRLLLAALVGLATAGAAAAQDAPLGSSLPGLLAHARAQSPDLAAMRSEAEAAAQRLEPAGALPDPVLRVELMNINNYGSDTAPSVLPWQVGETQYRLMQTLPGWGKRDLRRDLAAAEAQQAQARTGVTWAELAARIKSSFAEVYRATASERLTHELLDLMARLEQVAQARYAAGLAAQQDAIRAQIEQTAMRFELIALGNELRQLRARLNGLLARDASAPLADPVASRPLPDLASLDAAALAQRARAGNPQLRVEEARLESAQKGRELTFGNRYPDWQLGLQSTQVGSRFTSLGLMVEVNLPLQQAPRRAQEREAEAMVDAARSRTDALTAQLLGDLAGQLAAYDGARRTEALVGAQLLPQAELGLRSALAAYETGKADFTTVLDAERQIRKARLERLKLQAEAQMRLAEIERLLGEDL